MPDKKDVFLSSVIAAVLAAGLTGLFAYFSTQEANKALIETVKETNKANLEIAEKTISANYQQNNKNNEIVLESVRLTNENTLKAVQLSNETAIEAVKLTNKNNLEAVKLNNTQQANIRKKETINKKRETVTTNALFIEADIMSQYSALVSVMSFYVDMKASTGNDNTLQDRLFYSALFSVGDIYLKPAPTNIHSLIAGLPNDCAFKIQAFYVTIGILKQYIKQSEPMFYEADKFHKYMSLIPGIPAEQKATVVPVVEGGKIMFLKMATSMILSAIDVGYESLMQLCNISDMQSPRKEIYKKSFDSLLNKTKNIRLDTVTLKDNILKYMNDLKDAESYFQEQLNLEKSIKKANQE